MKRRNDALKKAKRLEETKPSEKSFNIQEMNAISSQPSTTRNASDKAKRAMTLLLMDESGDLDNSDDDPDFSPEIRKRRLENESSDDDVANYVSSNEIQTTDAITDEQEIESNNRAEEDSVHSHKKIRLSAEERFAQKCDKKQKKIESSYTIKSGCVSTCSRKVKCSDIFPEDARIRINTHFWKMDYSGRKSFIMERVNRCNAERTTKSDGNTRKNASFKYTFKSQDGNTTNVCKSFFLGTLGFNERNDTIITKTFKALHDPCRSRHPCIDGRGNHIIQCNHESIKTFINSYHPTISHYTREKTPLRRYLSCDISVKKMHEEYNLTHKKVSYSAFYKVFKQMKISITTLGNEECETCQKYRLSCEKCKMSNNSEGAKYSSNCEDQEFENHKEKFTAAREEYNNDKSDNTNRPNVLKFSADLQKVIVLPRMDQFKACVFTRRLVTFNETFSELGSKGRDVAILWHEAIAGRKDEDIASAFYKFILGLRDTNKLIIWLDNCAGQNKNWTIFSMFLFIVNDPTIEINEIHLKYFEPGHTFMASDAAHGRIEQSMKRSGKIFDFRDFIESVDKSKCEAVKMETGDFRNWQSGVSQYSLQKLGEMRPYLSDIVSARFVKGSETLRYKNKFCENETSVNFLKSSFDVKDCCGKVRGKERGVEPRKKRDIIQTLLPLMPQNRRTFWIDLPEDKKADDLIDNI